jgi:hypothetical protein
LREFFNGKTKSVCNFAAARGSFEIASVFDLTRPETEKRSIELTALDPQGRFRQEGNLAISDFPEAFLGMHHTLFRDLVKLVQDQL